jgi:VanZ family protein
MNPIFFLLSVGYVFVIIFLADSGAVSQIEAFNPYSLLHIPLYGLLTLLLLLSFCTGGGKYTRNRVITAGLIAGLVGALDEFHQIYIPTRDGSLGDVFLDILGAGLAILIFGRIYSAFFLKWRGPKVKGGSLPEK